MPVRKAAGGDGGAEAPPTTRDHYDPAHQNKFKAFLKGYAENGGTCLQVNMLDPDMLRDAQQHPENYPHLLVRITGYNTYFTAIGKELQNEVIERVSHQGY